MSASAQPTSAGVMRVPGSVAEVAASPEGPGVGAFFDFDGTLIPGYSARHLISDQLRQRDIGLGELGRTFAVGIQARLGLATFEDLLAAFAEAWAGRDHDDLVDLGERIFQEKIVDLIFPEVRELVRAHQARGHTVVLSSSATMYQAGPAARYLGIDHILCNRLTTTDGLLTGEVERPVLRGRGKAGVVQQFAADHSIDLSRSYFYADGYEDVALMNLVGNPRPTNPDKRLAGIARNRRWPVLRFTSRSESGPISAARSIAGAVSLLPIGMAGAAVGMVRGSRREAINFTGPRWCDAMLAVNGVKVNVVGRDHLETRPAVFIFNHRNFFDVFVVASLVRTNVTGVAKKELETAPVVSTLWRLADVAFIDRADTRSAVAALKPVEELARRGVSVVMAPEGTRMDTTGVGPFKKGAFRMAMAARIPITPIVLRNSELIAGRNATRMNAGTVDVAVLPPIALDDWTVKDLPARIEEVRQLYLSTLADWPG